VTQKKILRNSGSKQWQRYRPEYSFWV